MQFIFWLLYKKIYGIDLTFTNLCLKLIIIICLNINLSMNTYLMNIFSIKKLKRIKHINILRCDISKKYIKKKFSDIFHFCGKFKVSLENLSDKMMTEVLSDS